MKKVQFARTKSISLDNRMSEKTPEKFSRRKNPRPEMAPQALDYLLFVSEIEAWSQIEGRDKAENNT